MRKCKILIVFIVLAHFALIALDKESSLTWTFNRKTLEEKLPLGMTLDELTRVLEKEGIEVRFEIAEDLLLWKRGNVSISLSPSPFSSYHLWVSVEGKRTLDECSKDELADLYEAVWLGRKAVAEATGADGFMIVTTEDIRNGKGDRWVGFEVIPSGFGGSRGVMDAVEKNALNAYVFYNQFSKRSVSQSPEVVAEIRQRLQNLQPILEPEASHGHWTQKLLRHREALYENLQSIHDTLIQSGALVQGKMPILPVAEDHIHEIQIDLDKCAFCNSKVIDKQIVCEWKDIYILMSHKPISPYGNFLILPKRHQCAWDLTKEEAIASFEAIIGLKKHFQDTYQVNNWICYIQDGPSVGQTVPHTHIHFFILPDPLKSAISALQHIHNQRPILSYEEMRSNCDKAKPILIQYIQNKFSSDF